MYQERARIERFDSTFTVMEVSVFRTGFGRNEGCVGFGGAPGFSKKRRVAISLWGSDSGVREKVL